MHYLNSFSIQFCSPSWRSTLPFVPIVTFAYTFLLWIERIEWKYTVIRVIVHAVYIIRTEIQLNPNTYTKRERQIYAQCTFMSCVYKNLQQCAFNEQNVKSKTNDTNNLCVICLKSNIVLFSFFFLFFNPNRNTYEIVVIIFFHVWIHQFIHHLHY